MEMIVSNGAFVNFCLKLIRDLHNVFDLDNFLKRPCNIKHNEL